jgi:putative MATE family efflux protein
MIANSKTFWKYVAPAVGGMLICGSYSIVDTIFVGQGLGDIGLAGVALTWPIEMTVSAIASMIGSGAAVMLSQARGAKDELRARRIFGNMLLLEIIATVLCVLAQACLIRPLLHALGANDELMPTAYAYAFVMIFSTPFNFAMSGGMEVIRNDGHPVVAMIFQCIGLISNVILDYLFILVFPWGAHGAAAATAASMAISALCCTVYFFTPMTQLCRELKKNLNLEGRISRAICWTGLPIFGNTLSIVAMMAMHNWQALKYGHNSGLAAYTAVATIESLGSILMTGLAGGIQPLVAAVHGSGDMRAQKWFARYAYAVAFISGIVLMLFCYGMRYQIAGWIGLSDEVIHLAAHGILMSSSAFVLLGVIRVAAYYYQSTERIAASSLLIYGDAFFALPLCLFTLPLWFGMDGIWLAMPASRLILFAMLLVLIAQERRKN